MNHSFGRQTKRLLGLVLCILSFSLTAQEVKEKKKLKDVLSFSGYIKDMQVLTIADPAPTTTYNFIHNRLNLKYYPSATLTAALEVRNRIFFGSAITQIPDFADFVDVDNGYFDLTALVIKKKSMLAVVQVDRAWVDWYKGDWQVRVGRQRINWGKTLVWNPNDLFNSFNFTDFDYEEQEWKAVPTDEDPEEIELP
jgi:hypothetical protein